MSQNNLHKKPAATHALLLTLTYGEAVQRYCRWTNNITLGSNTFLAEPTLEVDLGLQHGGTEEKSHSLRIRSSVQPFANLIRGYRHAAVEVFVEELDPAEPATRAAVAKGWIGNVTRSPGGKAGLCKCEVVTVKSRIQDVRVSIPVLSSCDLTFGGDICGADTTPFELSGTVTAVSGSQSNIVTLDLPTVSDPASELTDAVYRRGRIVVDGLSLMISASLGDGSFALASLPPPWWLGRPAEVFPGCGKQLSDCQFWGRVSQFRGLGIKVPDRNPIVQASP